MFHSVDNQADIAVEVAAADRVGLFTEAINALTAILNGSEIVGSSKTREIKSKPLAEFQLTAAGHDDEERLVDILNDLIYACQVNRWFPLSVKAVELTGDQVIATMSGIRDGGGENLAREIKAATYHDLHIKKDEGWSARIVFDV